MYDAIVVGARCAGSPAAMLLARRGYRVLLVDKATFPSDTISTHVIWQPGVLRLKRWGLLEKVIASNCPPLPGFRFNPGTGVMNGSPPPADGVREFYCPRRTKLDKILLDAAATAGAEVREGFSVQEIAAADGRVTGIRGRSPGGSTVTENARVVIGADGLHSIVAQAVRPETYNEAPSVACYYYSYWSDVPLSGLDFHGREGGVVGALPTNDGLYLLAAGWTADKFHQVRADIEGSLLRAFDDTAPELAERVRAGKRQERFVGTADVPGVFRKPYGPGWALVGDAGYHKDPITAQGITDAFCTVELLVEALDAGFSGRQPLEEALAGYQRQRDESVKPRYDFACDFAKMAAPRPEQRDLFEALQGNQEEINNFLGCLAGTTSIPDFFAADNQRRIIDSAGSRRRPATVDG